MKKYLMIILAAIVYASCSNNDVYDSGRSKVQDNYDAAFRKYVGVSIPSNQDWGFGTAASAPAFDFTRSASEPSVPGITYDATWIDSYLETAKEPTNENVVDDYDNTTYATNWSVLNAIPWDGSEEDLLRQWFANNTDGLSWDELVAWALANRPTWISHNIDETYVRNFKITGTWDGGIGVAGSEGLTNSGEATNAERTIVVTGTWNITVNQRIGSLGQIIIADGGTVDVKSGVTLNMVNQARLVVLQGGTLTGAGKVEVNNGNAEGLENYNAGTIDVAKFNNNFGKFHNYGKFLVNEYEGGAQESNFYNHALVAIDHFVESEGSTANARIFNGCQFYVKNNARIRNYEGINGSALVVGGELMFSSSEDGTSDPTYVGLQQGALVKCATLYNNGTSWTGPTSGYAALEITDKITYLNWEQDHPELGGYFANNIYVKASTWTNVPDGNGYHQTDPSDAYNHSISIADYKFFSIVANCVGNGGVTKVLDSDDVIFDASEDFELGVDGCTPGFKGKVPEDEPTPKPDIRIIAEDLSASDDSDFDFNDVVFDVTFTSATTATITLKAAGGTLPLRVAGREVHKEFGDYPTTTMINTHAAKYATNGYGYADNVPEVSFPVENIDRDENGKDILIEVQKQDEDGNDKWYPITAEQGEPAAKLGVDPKFQWVDEKVSLKSVYDQVTGWVANPDVKWY